jgi:hypothetical protein
VDVGDLGDLFGSAQPVASATFEALFGARRRRAGAGFAMRGQDVEAAIGLSLEEASRDNTRHYVADDSRVSYL